MSVKVYYSSLRKQQQSLFLILESKGISFERLDIADDSDLKEEMRDRAGNPKALAPQICNGDVYWGDYAAFDKANEDEALETFLKL